MLAVISDIHSNSEALAAVLADIAERNVGRIVCLGDVVGYGPDPTKCLDLVMEKASVALMGNHDYAVMYEPHQFNIGAEAACYWTRRQLEDETDSARRNGRWDFLGNLPVKGALSADSATSAPAEPAAPADKTAPAGQLNGGQWTFVHGSPRRPINEYIFPDDVYNNVNKLQGLFDRFERLCFVGHTHVPGVFTDTPDFYSPDELENVFEVGPGRKAIINVGSVGQPRDRDPRAAYVLVEGETIRFVRVAYDIEAVVAKVLAIPELDDYLGIRLREGR